MRSENNHTVTLSHPIQGGPGLPWTVPVPKIASGQLRTSQQVLEASPSRIPVLTVVPRSANARARARASPNTSWDYDQDRDSRGTNLWDLLGCPK